MEAKKKNNNIKRMYNTLRQQIEEEEYFKNGKKAGPILRWYESGAKKAEINYENGEMAKRMGKNIH